MDSRKAVEKLLGSLDIDHSQYKFGQTKVEKLLAPAMRVGCELPLFFSGVFQGGTAGSAGRHERCPPL